MSCYYSGGSTQRNVIAIALVGLSPSQTSYMLVPTKTKSEKDYDNSACGPTRAKGKIKRNGVLEAAGSTRRARQKPADRTPTEIRDISEATERGARMLAAPIAHEVYHQFLPGGIDGD